MSQKRAFIALRYKEFTGRIDNQLSCGQSLTLAMGECALTLVKTLHLFTLCRLAARLAHRRCVPPLPAGPGGAPRTYSEESLLLIALLRTLWRLSYQDMRDWLCAWPALVLACGLPLGKDGHPRIPSPSQQCKRGQQGGAPLSEALFVLSVLIAIRRRLIGARDLIIDSAPPHPCLASH
ncbi:MAG: hypothetical protein M3Y76_13200 [Chloroflexota bacterium]|nr:hypothetical protein [Chloroflexota bacterium]